MRAIYVCSVTLLFVSISSCNGYNITAITPPVRHAEGPHWIDKEQMLYFLDTFTPAMNRWDNEAQKLSTIKLEKYNSIGIMIPIKGTKNEFVVGADEALFRFKWPTDEGEKPQWANLIDTGNGSQKSERQYNDGKADCQGRVWAGILTRNEDLTVQPNGGCMYMITVNETILIEEKISKTSISNGIAWSKNSDMFYFIDSNERTVTGYNYNPISGKISNKTTVFDLHDYPELRGIPDGMIIDENDNLWVALFGGHSVIQVNPATGKLIKTIRMPATYVTSVCFGGPDLDILFVTTSKLHLNATGQLEEPSAGSVFVIAGLGVKGVPGHEAIFKID